MSGAPKQRLNEKFNPTWVYSKGYWRKFRRWIIKEKGDEKLAAWLSEYKTLLAFIEQHPTHNDDLVSLWHEWIADTGGWVKKPKPPERNLWGWGGMAKDERGQDSQTRFSPSRL